MKNLFLLALSLFLIYIPIDGQNVNELKSKAMAGDAQAQYDYSVTLLNSNKNIVNYIEVLKWLRASAQKGNLKSKDLLRRICKPGHEGWGDFTLIQEYDYGVLSEETREWLEEYAIKGCSSDSCKGHYGFLVILAHSYFHHEDYTKAVFFYKQALSKMKWGNLGRNPFIEEKEDFTLYHAWADAYSMLGYCYEHGYGVMRDYKTALDYYSIGDIDEYYDSSGVRKLLREINNSDLTEEFEGESVFYYGDLGEKGSYLTAKKLMLYTKLGLTQFVEKHLEGVESILTPDPRFSYHFAAPELLWCGEIYYREKNYSMAYRIFNHIVNNLTENFDLYELFPDVYADACYRLYECYAFGRGVERDASKSGMYFKQALKFGSSSAIYDDQKRYEIVNK